MAKIKKTTNPATPNDWLEQYGDVLFRYAMIRIHNQMVAEDLVQETLLGAIQSQDSYRRQSSVRTWLIGIMKHKIIDFLRKTSRERPMNDVDVAELADANFDKHGNWQTDVKQWSNPELALQESQFWRIFYQCIEQLPPDMAQLFMLREVDGLAADDLCKTLNISTPNNVWVRLSRIRMRLRLCLENKWFAQNTHSSS